MGRGFEGVKAGRSAAVTLFDSRRLPCYPSSYSVFPLFLSFYSLLFSFYSFLFFSPLLFASPRFISSISSRPISSVLLFSLSFSVLLRDPLPPPPSNPFRFSSSVPNRLLSSDHGSH